MWPFFLARKQLFPPRKFPVFAFVSILGVAFGVTALLVVQTVMNSFGEEHRKRIRESLGDVIVQAQRGPLEGVSQTVAGLLALPDVAEGAAYIDGGVVLIQDAENFNFLGARGIDVAREGRVVPLERYLVNSAGMLDETVLDELDDDRVILGSMLARSLGVGVHGRITVQSPLKLARSLEGQAVSLPKELEVCGLIHTGSRDVDENAFFITLRTARELFSMPPDSATAVHLKLKDHRKAEAFAEKMDTRLPGRMRAVPWSAVNKAFLDAVAMEKQMLFLLMFIITLVASFSIGSTLFSHVVRRTREIGLIGALGGRPGHILRLFLAQGFLIGVAGYGIGVALTFTIMYFRQNIVALMGARDTLLKQYRFDSVPLHYDGGDFLKAAVLTVVLMTLASLLPALWAARRKPSEAMRDVV